MTSRRLAAFGALIAGGIIILGGCSSGPPAQTGGIAAPQPGGGYSRAHDGPPEHFKDVSSIPDAIPVPHTGRYKATPYEVLGKRYTPLQNGFDYRAEGSASWYGSKFHGYHTANGEEYDLYGMTAAHKTLPLPTYVQVTNLENNRKVIVRVNDRGPFYSDRIIDLSYAAAAKLGFADKGTARVRVEGIDPVAWQQKNNPGYLVTAPAVQQPQQPVVASRAAPAAGEGYFLQVGAFSSAQAAEHLRSQLQSVVNAHAFVTPVVANGQTLHRVRLGPVSSPDEAQRITDTLRTANLGNATLVTSN